MNQLSILRQNITRYTRRFYLARMLSGSLISLSLLLGLFLLFASLEYFLHMDSFSRGLLFYGFVTISLGVIGLQIVLPLLQMTGAFRGKSETDAANEIGKKIPSIEDKLNNVLNLNWQIEKRPDALALAGLNKRSSELNAFDFTDAVDLKSSLVWLKYTLIPLLVLFGISLWNPAMLRDSAERIVRYNESFIPPALFEFQVLNEQLSVPEGDDFILTVKTSGNALPDNCFVISDGSEFRMRKQTDGHFSFTFNKVQQSRTFQLRGASVYSSELTIEALPKPRLIRSEAYLDYPSYTGLTNESVVNRTSLKIPEGTVVRWKLDLRNVPEPLVMLNSDKLVLSTAQGSGTVFEHRFVDDGELKVNMKSDANLSDSAVISVKAVKDQFPLIGIEERIDSLSGIHYFTGQISDDYGFKQLRFQVLQEGRSVLSEPIKVNEQILEQRVVYAWQPDSLVRRKGEQFEYFFIVSDNDGVNGSKETRSRAWKLVVPSEQALRAANEKMSEDTKQTLNDNAKRLDEMDKTIEELRKELLDKRKPDWQEQEKLKELLEEQQQMMEELQKEAQKKRAFQERNESLNQFSEELMKKQERIQEMYEKLFDEDFKKKYEEYNKLLEEMNKQEMLDKLEEMKLDNETLEKELDRTLELFKELEFEQKLEENINKLKDLKEDQDDLKKQTDDKAAEPEELSEKQEEIEKEFSELKEELSKMEELNQALEEPKPTPDLDQESKDASEAMEKAKESLQEKNEGKASKEQKKSSEQLNEMANKLDQFKQQQSASQQSEDLDNMRQLMENILDLSLEQERILEGFKQVQGNNPQYVRFAKEQKDLIDDTKIVEDSLVALSKRVPQIDRVINDEITQVKFSMDKALNFMTEQPPNQEKQYMGFAAERQQYAMTSLNNLALLFDEIIQNMQKQMAESMKGTGQCEKPGSGKGSKPSASDMKKMQESLNKQLEKLKDAKEKGKNPNGKKPGEESGDGLGGQSKELARMAAEQAALRKQLRQMSESLDGERGGRAGDQLKEIEKMMEQTEEDILFDQIDAQTLRRQEEILTKLLESEKAEREQEMDRKRESKSGKENFEIPDDIWDAFDKQKEKEIEFYKTMPPNLKPFYRNEVNRYFSNFPNEN